MVTTDTKKRLLHSLTCLQLLYSDQPALIYKFNFLFVLPHGKSKAVSLWHINYSNFTWMQTAYSALQNCSCNSKNTTYRLLYSSQKLSNACFLATMTTKFVLMESDYTDNSPINNMTSCVINTIRLQQKRQKWTTLRHFFISHLLIFHVQSL